MKFSLKMAGALVAASVAMAAVAEDAAAVKKPIKVMMIGNSFSVSNMPHLPKVAAAMGIPLDLCSMCIGGCSLERHWNNVEKADDAKFLPYSCSRNVCGVAQKGRSANLPQELKATAWDVVTIQQCSHFSWQAESYHPWGDKLVAKIRELAPQAKIVVQETWSYTPWDGRLKKWGIDQNEMYAKLHAAYGDFAGKYGFEVIPMGTAVQNFRRELPVKYAENSFGGDVCGGIGLKPEKQFEQDKNGKWHPAKGVTKPGAKKPTGRCDVFHLNGDGQYFQALVWAAKLFKADVRTCAYAPAGMDPKRAELMKKIAYESAK